MAAKGDVELIIRAKNEATKNLDAINKSLKQLADQQTIVGDSAGKADDQLGRLGLELAKLQTNAQNLKALSTVGDVLDKAAAAMERQRAAAEESALELARVTARQKELSAENERLSTSAKAAAASLKQQDNALKTAKSSLGELNKETTSLANREKSLSSAIETAATALAKRQAALDAAAKKQAELSAAVNSGEKATKAQVNSLDAANRSLERRRAAVEETVKKEAELRQELAGVRTALATNATAVEKANAALATQVSSTNAARDAAAKLKVEASSVAKAERDIVKDVTAASNAVQQQAASLNEAQSEYGQVEAAAKAARAAITGTTTGADQAGSAAGRAALKVAEFAARLKVLAGAGTGKTSNPLNINPAEISAADAALSKLDSTLKAAGNDATKASVSADELGAALKGVGAAQSTLQGISNAVTSQAAAVDGAKAAWKTAEAEVRRLALALRDADQPSAELAAAFGKAQGAARLAKDEFVRQTQAANQIAGALQSAGVGVGTLSSAEAALGPQLSRANNLMNQGAAAAQKMGSAVNQTGNNAAGAQPKVSGLANAISSMVGAANRAASATNPLRAFKNELFAMVAASAGLYAIKEQLTAIWEAGTQLASNTSKYATAFGSIAEGNKEMAYARDVALNLKLPLGDLTKSYADLALAAKGGALEGEGARKVFVAFAQATRVNGGSADDLNGIFRALTQSMSKGKVQAEELRGQLGDRMPGAIQLMAQGLGVTTAKLDEMLEKGQLTSEALVNMAAAVSTRVGPQLAAALDSPAAKLANFQNRVQIFRETIAGSGFLDAVADAFDKVANALSSPEAIQGAKDLGQALADLVTWLIDASQHMDTIITAIQALGVAWVGLQIMSMVSGFYAFVTAIGATTIAVLALDVALSPVLIGLAALAAVVATVVGAFGLWKLAEWAYENFPAFAEGVLGVKNAALTAWDGIMQAWEMTGVRLKNSFAKITAQIADMWYGMLDKVVNAFPELNAKIGLGEFGADIAKRAAEAAAALKTNEENLNASLNEIRERYARKEGERQKQLQDDIAAYYTERIRKTLTEEELAAGKGGAADLARGLNPNNSVQFPGAKPYDPTAAGLNQVTANPYQISTAKADEAAAKKAAAARVSLEKSVADQMFTIRSQLEKKSAETVDEQMAAVPAKYAKLYGQLTALGKDRTSEEWKTVDALVAQEQANIKSVAAKKAATAAAKESREAEAAETKSRKDAMTEVNALMQTRKNLQDQIAQAEARGDTTGVEDLKANLATVTEQATNAINSMLAFWQSVGGPQADAAIAKLQAMQLQITKSKTETEKFQNKIGETFGTKLLSGVDAFVDKFAETGNLFASAKEAFLEFARSFLIEIAKMILKQLLFNALKAGLSAIGGGGAIGAGITSVGASQLHSGGTAGAPGTGGSQRRMVNPAIFANAVRFHGGGVPGLKSNEVPAVLEAGEVVRTEQQEKALAAQQAADRAAAAGGNGAQSIKIVNAIDSASVVSEGLNTSNGQKAVINMIRANRSSIKQILG